MPSPFCLHSIIKLSSYSTARFAKMTELETAVAMIIDVFDRYAATEGDKDSLTKGELKTLVEKELPGILSSAKENDASEELLKDLDQNGDSKVDFNEFVVFAAALASIGHERFKNVPPKK
ncbi:protein S100-P-like [Spea bombifrons]|uniref:protein S100-P-like n=1 Tax=Spea bombifrons TaxID=233779 RepID=UPI00234BA00E|nr:protein S100-P-like [Spea bombifrons]